MITLYALDQSRSTRIAWLFEELGLAYQLEQFARDKQTKLAPQALRQIHPLGKSPTLVDGELVLAESGAIVEYVLTRYGNGRLRPAAESPFYPQYLHWLHYAEGSLMPLFILSLIFNKIERQPMPFFVKPIANKIVQKVRESYISPNLKLHLDYIEAHLAKHQWFAGELSAADIMMSFPLQAAVTTGFDHYPHIRRYVAQLESLPCYQKAEQRTGKLNLKALA